MFYFEYEGQTFRVRFAHDQGAEGTVLRQGGKVAYYRGKTTVLVERKVGEKQWETVAESYGYRSQSDKNFDRRLGREAALKRLVFERRDLQKAFKREMFGAIYDA